MVSGSQSSGVGARHPSGWRSKEWRIRASLLLDPASLSPVCIAVTYRLQRGKRTGAPPMVGDASIHPTPRFAHFPLQELGSLFSCFFKTKACMIIISGCLATNPFRPQDTKVINSPEVRSSDQETAELGFQDRREKTSPRSFQLSAASKTKHTLVS